MGLFALLMVGSYISVSGCLKRFCVALWCSLMGFWSVVSSVVCLQGVAVGVRSGVVVGRSGVSGGLLPWLPSGGVHGLIGYYLPYDWAMSGRKSWNNYGIITE